MRVTVEDASLEQVLSVLPDIRPADLREWYGGTGRWFEEAVAEVFQDETPKRVALVDGIPAVFWGWDSNGSIWLFATKRAEEYALPLHRILRPQLAEILKDHPVVSAVADSRNTKHHEWLHWLGFRSGEVVHCAPFGLPFIVFTKEA